MYPPGQLVRHHRMFRTEDHVDKLDCFRPHAPISEGASPTFLLLPHQCAHSAVARNKTLCIVKPVPIVCAMCAFAREAWVSRSPKACAKPKVLETAGEKVTCQDYWTCQDVVDQLLDPLHFV